MGGICKYLFLSLIASMLMLWCKEDLELTHTGTRILDFIASYIWWDGESVKFVLSCYLTISDIQGGNITKLHLALGKCSD